MSRTSCSDLQGKKPQTNPKSDTKLNMWELAQVFDGLFGLTYPQERKRNHLCLQSKCSTFLSSALLSQKGCLQSCCWSGKDLSLENAEGDLLRWKGLKNRSESLWNMHSIWNLSAVTAIYPKLLLRSSRAPRSTSESISTKTIRKSKWETAHFSNHFQKGWAFNPSSSEASLPLL